MKTKLLFAITAVLGLNSYSQTPNWPAIKTNYQAIVAIPAEFGTPYIQPLNTGGWEDGLFISPDGLHLYAFYMPIDLFSWQSDIDISKPCPYPFLGPYYRGPLIGIDTITAPPACDSSWNHSDIVYAYRTNTSLPFTTWTTSNLATSLTSEGAVHSIPKNSDTADIFVFNRANPGFGIDIMIMQNVPNNPSATIASPINDLTTTDDEGNPHIIRIDASNLVIFFNNSEAIPSVPPDIFYSTSSNNGLNWQPKQLVTSVNTPYHDIQPHLYYDGTDWWMYFASADTLGTGLLSIFRARQTIPGNWNSWDARQLVIGPGLINGGYGQALAVGEPTLTQWGDISFVVIYADTNSTDTTDMYDADPWFLPNKNSPLSVFPQPRTQQLSYQIYPNPVQDKLNILPQQSNGAAFVKIYNITGEMIKEELLNKNITTIAISDMSVGLYFYQISDSSGNILGSGKFMKE